MNREETALRPELYYLLSMGMRLPSRELADQIGTGGFWQHMLEITETAGAEESNRKSLPVILAKMWQPEMEAEGLHELRREYTRLFTTPRQALFSLYESLARGQSRMMFENTLARHAEDCYRRGGLQIEKRQQEPADYLPVELEFASLLTAELSGEEAVLPLTGKQCEDLWQEFYDVHLSGWLKEYWLAVARETGSGFYRRLAETGAALAEWEEQRAEQKRLSSLQGPARQKEQNACGNHPESR